MVSMNAAALSVSEFEHMLRAALSEPVMTPDWKLGDERTAYDEPAASAMLGDLTAEQLRALVGRIVREELDERALFDAEDEMDLDPEFARELQERLSSPGRLYSAAEVAADLRPNL